MGMNAENLKLVEGITSLFVTQSGLPRTALEKLLFLTDRLLAQAGEPGLGLVYRKHNGVTIEKMPEIRSAILRRGTIFITPEYRDGCLQHVLYPWDHQRMHDAVMVLPEIIRQHAEAVYRSHGKKRARDLTDHVSTLPEWKAAGWYGQVFPGAAVNAPAQ